MVDGKLTPLPYESAWKEALETFLVQLDDLYAGWTPRTTAETFTVADLCNHFLTAKLERKKSGELGTRMFAEYTGTTDLIVAARLATGPGPRRPPVARPQVRGGHPPKRRPGSGVGRILLPGRPPAAWHGAVMPGGASDVGVSSRSNPARKFLPIPIDSAPGVGLLNG